MNITYHHKQHKNDKTCQFHMCSFDSHHNTKWIGSKCETQYHTVTCLHMCTHAHTHIHTHVSVGGIAGADTLRQIALCSLQCDLIMLAKLKKVTLGQYSELSILCVCIYFSVCVFVYVCGRVKTPTFCTLKASLFYIFCPDPRL